MAQRTVTADADAWQRVATAVIRRRTELDLRAQDVASAADGISTSVLSLIENARQSSYTRRSLAALCRALEWRPDSIERLLEGEEPQPVAAGDRRVESTAPRRPASIEELDELDDRLNALERRVAALEAELTR